MARWVQRMGVRDQVTVLNQVVDVNQVLARVHASIVLATTPAIVKAYPHSLIESLAAGKPVLVSRAIPMARYIEKTGCGVVVDGVSPDGILGAVKALAGRYAAFQKATQQAGQDFSQQCMIASYRRVYEQARAPEILSSHL